MPGATNLSELIKEMSPKLHQGVYIFSTISDMSNIDRQHTIGEFKEEEGTTIIIKKEKADELGLSYEYEASWITLMTHSSLYAVGLVAKFSTELAKHNISCNVISGYYHDHIFVEVKDGEKALAILTKLSERH